MANYIDWEYYNSHFPLVSEDAFNTLNIIATKKIDILTHRRSQTAIDLNLEQLKDCICNLINTIYEQKNNNSGNGITSTSNDGYSESYNNVTKNDAENELRSVAIQWLSGTGMMGVL